MEDPGGCFYIFRKIPEQSTIYMIIKAQAMMSIIRRITENLEYLMLETVWERILGMK